MTVLQASARTGLSTGYIRQALIDRQLAGEKIGRDWLIEEAELLRWVNRDKKKAGRPRRPPAAGPDTAEGKP